MKMKQTRREFLDYAGKGLVGLTLVSAISPRTYAGIPVSENGTFSFKSGSVPERYILAGNTNSVQGNLYFTNLAELIVNTKQYESISKEDLKNKNAKYWTALEAANNEVHRWVKDYARLGDVMINREYFDTTSLQIDKIFESVPKAYENKTLMDIVNSLDITQDMIRRYDK